MDGLSVRRTCLVLLCNTGCCVSVVHVLHTQYRMAQKSVNWLVKCILKYVRNFFITYRIYKNCPKWVFLKFKAESFWHEQHKFDNHSVLISSSLLPYVPSGILPFMCSDCNCACISHLFHACHMPFSFHSPGFYRPNSKRKVIPVTSRGGP
jgi:hypothetical protein